MAATRTHRQLPTPDERLLLLAASLPDQRAIDAWQQWLQHNDLQDAGQPVFNLLPAVYRNLAAIGAETPALLRGIYNRSWVNNQKLFQSVAAVLRLFADVGIPAMLLKGGALATQYYHDSGTRPMYDVDILVPTDQAQAAYDLLRSDGWTPLVTPGGPMEHVVQVVRSCDMRTADGTNLDLHWHAMVDRYGASADADLWHAAVEQQFSRVPTLALCPADLLLLVIVHGSKWDKTRSVLWLLDAYRIIVAGGDSFDWQRLVDQARQRAALLPVTAALDYLRRELGSAVPVSALSTLHRQRSGLIEKLEYRAESTGDSFPAMILRDTLGHLRRTCGRSTAYRLRSWGWYLQASWGVPSASLLAQQVVRRLRRRLQYSHSLPTPP